MKEFKFTKEALAADARALMYDDCVGALFKALGLPDEITVAFTDEDMDMRGAIGIVQEAIQGAYCGTCDDLNGFLCFRAASLADAYRIMEYSCEAKEKDGVTTIQERVVSYQYGTDMNIFAIADGMLFNLEGNIEGYLKGENGL